MNTITKIQIEFGRTEAPLEIPVRQVTATASRLPGVDCVVSRTKPGGLVKVNGANRRSIEPDQFIARIRAMLRKQGAQ